MESKSSTNQRELKHLKDALKSYREEKKSNIKVGIPRALHFYRFFPFWKKLLEELGCELIISPPTNKQIVEEGAFQGFGELCLPVKVYYGHVLYLAREHPELDYLFVPRYVSERTDGYFCPKFLSLPDVIRTLENIPEILTFTINVKENPISNSIISLAKILGKGQRAALEAYDKAKKYHNQYLRFLRAGAPVGYALKLVEKGKPFKMTKKKKSRNIKFLLLGHGYNIFDTFVNLDFQKKLTKQGVEVITIENLPESIFKAPVIINKQLRNYWGHEEEILSAVRYFLTKGRHEIDGVVFLISFACGPDSLIAELIMRDMKVLALPFLQIIMDEHTGEAGLLTRIESFVEMIKRKKRKLEALEEKQKLKVKGEV
jgi:predicted nucleotide-binding protein (sugar kinase/HSP70/actin superfamily)